ncbi:hypothetical protein GGTG_11084 [Gaeumannomyces tritici R3-111a-1]|uniref:Uncharacterized protein n=1 Tax=Gaeumannomyces tritici (strain R3-111a-1) TaxID=644352 RepID=J3PC61_GAET3|nr:hypothetical protein GGTG_11084 [Gaeumannomyces tritici R3-111a-1]EJT71831.1 hypothetical protein GGTG_11084 [Gaeumannomyces tritici R3-111a-1]
MADRFSPRPTFCPTGHACAAAHKMGKESRHVCHCTNEIGVKVLIQPPRRPSHSARGSLCKKGLGDQSCVSPVHVQPTFRQPRKGWWGPLVLVSQPVQPH